MLVRLDSVKKTYRRGSVEVPVLFEVFLTLAPGEFVAIEGPSGSGKSTLCNLLSLIDTPTSGRVFFDGRDTTHLSDDESSRLRARLVGIVFQSFNLIPVLSALENVILPLEFLGTDNRSAREAGMRRLAEVGIANLASSLPAQMSGGQQQRVALARALVTGPRLVVADEPTANLDTATALDIIRLMREINRTSGTTFVFATHDNRLLTSVDRVVQLRDGAIVENAGDA